MSARSILDHALLLEFRLGRAEFYRDFAEMFRRNEAMASFLEGEIANAQATRQASRARALRLVLRRLQGGEDASQVSTLLTGVVPGGDAMLLLAVDRAGDKSQALLALAAAVEQQQAMRRVVLAQCALPLAIVPICQLLIVLLGEVILAIAQCTPVYAEEALWSGMNGWARTIAAFAGEHGGEALLAMATAVGVVAWSLPRWRGALRLRVEGLPVYGLYRDFQAGVLLSSMAMLLRTGETLQGSIDDIARRASPWMRWHLGRVRDALDEEPTAVLDAFRRGLLSPHLLARAATLARSSPSFADVLVALGTTEGDRVLRRVRLAARAANVALVGAIAAVATFMGVASVTVPGTFAQLMEPSTLMGLRARYEAEHPPP